VIVAIFGTGYLIAHLAHASASTAVLVGALAAGPVGLAFIWERLAGLKLFGVEVTLSQVIVPVDRTLATALSEHQWFSENEAIFKLVDRAIKNPNIELLEINLRARMEADTGMSDAAPEHTACQDLRCRPLGSAGCRPSVEHPQTAPQEPRRSDRGSPVARCARQIQADKELQMVSSSDTANCVVPAVSLIATSKMRRRPSAIAVAN
jgi:hypothetical protein